MGPAYLGLGSLIRIAHALAISGTVIAMIRPASLTRSEHGSEPVRRQNTQILVSVYAPFPPPLRKKKRKREKKKHAGSCHSPRAKSIATHSATNSAVPLSEIRCDIIMYTFLTASTRT